MKIETFTIVVPGIACNAKCPYCVAKMTPKLNAGMNLGRFPQPSWRNFDKACRLAQINNVSTVLLTGKGEPTLEPIMVNCYMNVLQQYNFPFIELQTNGILIAKNILPDAHLERWYNDGMTTIAISMIPERPWKDIQPVVDHLHKLKFSVRLNFIMYHGGVDSFEFISNISETAKRWGVEQLTFNPVNAPSSNKESEEYKWVETHKLDSVDLETIRGKLYSNGRKLLELPHGAIVFDLDGQNVCLSNCLTVDNKTDTLRNLIFFPDGHLRYNWEYPGAILL